LADTTTITPIQSNFNTSNSTTFKLKEEVKQLQEYERQNIDIGKIYLQHRKHFNGSNQQEYCQIDNFLGEILSYMIHKFNVLYISK
jgi:hypothetical protein